MPEKPAAEYIRKGVSSKEIFEALKKQIVNGQLAGDTQLKQGLLAQQFGVSKIPVREALRQLEILGLVAFRPRYGAMVIALSTHDIICLLDARLALECRALALSIPKLAPSEFLQAYNILQEYSQQTDANSWSRLNIQFHDTLYQACENPYLLRYIEDVRNRMGPFLQLHTSMAAGIERPHSEHIQILEACETRDVELATRILSKHITTTQQELLSFMRSHTEQK